jgi:hypothetical protein
VLSVVLLAACTNPTTLPAASTTPPPPVHRPAPSLGKPHWLITDQAVGLIRRAGLPSSLIRYFFDNTGTYLIEGTGASGRGGPVPHDLPRAIPVELFASYALMKRAFQKKSVPPGTRAIAYDNEAWDLTPPNEISHPLLFAARAEGLAHQHGLKFIFTPATDLFTGGSGNPAASTSRFKQYLAFGMAARGSRLSDAFEIQAQGAEATPEFLPFAVQAAEQARKSNPSAEVRLGLSTNPGGRQVTAQDLIAAYHSARAEVSGFWLNVPPAGPGCPKCGTGHPELAVAFLQALAHRLGA